MRYGQARDAPYFASTQGLLSASAQPKRCGCLSRTAGAISRNHDSAPSIVAEEPSGLSCSAEEQTSSVRPAIATAEGGVRARLTSLLQVLLSLFCCRFSAVAYRSLGSLRDLITNPPTLTNLHQPSPTFTNPSPTSHQPFPTPHQPLPTPHQPFTNPY